MKNIILLILSVLFSHLAFSNPSRVEVALTDNFVPVTMTFKGSKVTLMGSLAGEGDVIVEVRGLPGKAQVWRKARMLGVWGNKESIIFDSVPGFYMISSNKKIENILSLDKRRQARIGIEYLIKNPKQNLDQINLKNWKDALIRNMEAQGRWIRHSNEVQFVGDNLFKTEFTFPANAPIGSYEIYVYAIEDQHITSAQSASLTIDKVGVLARIWEMAQFNPILYGILSLFVACSLGYIITTQLKRI